MLRPLRWRLTFLYLLASIGLVSLMGAGAYFLIGRYFDETTDLALRYKMAIQFRLLGLSLPSELTQAEQTWLQNNNLHVATRPTAALAQKDEHEDESEENEEEENEHSADSQGSKETTGEAETHLDEDSAFDADLAAIFVLSLDDNGDPILLPNQSQPPVARDQAALASARQAGYDLRTVDVQGKGRVRLLTYRTGVSIPALLQTGRLLNDQARALNQYFISLVVLGSFSTLGLAALSWWLAGRSLGPAQRAWDQQQAFVSNASHELRTPLTLIRATADYARRSHSPDEQKKLLGDILSECDYMDRLVDDLLLLSRLDAHRLKLNLEAVPIAGLFDDLARQVGKLAGNNGVTLVVNDSPGRVRADSTRLRQVLLILLDNALRFTPAGGSIHLSAKPAGKFVQIEVADSGSGIAPEHLPHLFERFYQARAPENEASRSNGLGLAIARSLVDAQRGSIDIHSQPGKGTQVQLLFPLA